MNVAKLKGKMVENGMTRKTLANATGITFATMVRRLDKKHNGKTFAVDEIDRVVKALNLTEQDAMDIFFDFLSHKCDG